MSVSSECYVFFIVSGKQCRVTVALFCEMNGWLLKLFSIPVNPGINVNECMARGGLSVCHVRTKMIKASLEPRRA